MTKPQDAGERYRPLSARRRWLLLLLAAATAVAVIGTLLDPPGGVKRTGPKAAEVAPCAAGQASGCVGGKAEVIVLPAAASR